MKTLAIITRDIKSYLRNRIKLLSLAVAVLLPLAYGFLYLWAFWNPYENMKSIPVAIVDEDAGIVRNDQQENYGERIAAALQETDVLAWTITDLGDARRGLDQQRYYAIILIPESFSADLASIEDEDPRQAVISWQTRDSTNFLFTTYFKNVIAVLGDKINGDILPEFSQGAQMKLEVVEGKLEEASDGADCLSEGLGQLEAGSKTLETNLKKAGAGSEKLSEGLGNLDSQSHALNSGLAQLSSGSAILSAGLDSASTGSASLEDGLVQLGKGTGELKDGSTKLEAGTRELSAGASDLNAKLEATDASFSPLYPILDEISSVIGRINERSSLTLPDYIDSAKDKKDALLDGTEQLSEGSSMIADKMSDLDEGIGKIDDGISSARSGASTLSDGISQLDEGSDALHQGAVDIADGTAQYTAGVNSAYFGSKELSDGIGQLADGSGQMSQGLAGAKSGADSLSLGLAQGQEQLKNELAPDKIGTLMSIINEPVSFTNDSSDANPTYGAGFAPYFIPLALWMGALILTLLVPTRDSRLSVSKASRLEITIGKFFLLAVVGTAQSLLLALSLICGLGMEVRYPIAFILFCMLISLTFIAVMQFLSFLLGKVGELTGIIILMIQLTSASGTFPVESAPRFFQLCHPLVPMTYAIRGLRLFILGGDMDIAIRQSAILAGFLLAFLTAKTLATKKTVRATDIYPLIEL